MKKFVRIINTLIITVGCAFFLLSCFDIFDFRDSKETEEETGTFSLVIGSEGPSRTILPTTTLSDFDGYTLVFTPTSGSPLSPINRTNSDRDDPVTLTAGTWSLTVTAIINSEEAARGTLDEIEITAGQNTNGSLTLKPITNGAPGTFTWNITYPGDVSIATMDINQLDGTPVLDFNLKTDPNSTVLNSGYYHVVFNLTNPMKSIVMEQYLHIYPSMDSVFSFAFNAGHFSDGTVTVPVTDVTLDKATLALTIGGTTTGTLTATLDPTNATNQNVSWNSSAPGVATVTGTGLGPVTVTAVTAGTTTVTVTTADGSYTASCLVTVSPANIPVTDVTLDKATLALTIGGTTTGTLTATLDPTNATNQNVSWNSSAPGVATVTGTGLGPVTVTAVTAGTTTVTVTTADGSHTASCLVTVSPANIAVTDVTLDKATLALTIGGTTTGTLTATLDPINATNQNVSWNSSAPGVATVTGTGLGPVTVTAVTAGTTTVTVTTADGSYTASCLVTVTIPVTDVTLDKATLALTIGGTTTGTLTATLDPINATNQNVSWNSSAPGVATVTGTGLGPVTVTAVTAGTTTVTVTTADGSYTASCLVTVTIPVTDVTLDKATLALTIGGTTTGTLSATLDPTNATNQNVSWSTSAPGVATVTGTGLGPVTVTAVTAGTATVTVTTADGSYTASCLVTVSAGLTDGTATITITLAQITDIAPSITVPTLSKSGTSVTTPPNSVDLAVIGVFDSVSWSVGGDPVGTGAAITLDADDYDVGSHFLTVLVMKDGAPYNKTVSFTVED